MVVGSNQKASNGNENAFCGNVVFVAEWIQSKPHLKSDQVLCAAFGWSSGVHCNVECVLFTQTSNNINIISTALSLSPSLSCPSTKVNIHCWLELEIDTGDELLIGHLYLCLPPRPTNNAMSILSVVTDLIRLNLDSLTEGGGGDQRD